jgi:hypothetical protein
VRSLRPTATRGPECRAVASLPSSRQPGRLPTATSGSRRRPRKACGAGGRHRRGGTGVPNGSGSIAAAEPASGGGCQPAARRPGPRACVRRAGKGSACRAGGGEQLRPERRAAAVSIAASRLPLAGSPTTGRLPAAADGMVAGGRGRRCPKAEQPGLVGPCRRPVRRRWIGSSRASTPGGCAAHAPDV